MSRPRQYRWNSFRNLKTLGTNEKLPLPQLLFQAVQVNLNVPGDRMAWRQIFRLDLRSATGTIDFHNPHPERVRRKIEFGGNQRRMNFPRIAIIEQAAFFVVLPRRTNGVPAAVTQPALLLNIQVQIFRDPYAALLGGCHGFLPSPSLGTAISFPLTPVQFRVSKLVEHERPAFGNKISAVFSFEHRTTIHAIPRLERLPAVKLRLALRTSPGDASRSFDRGRRISSL